jgi:activator of 2-hydroxyglutaryl-CoA dehydratase
MNGICAGGTGSFIDQMASLIQTDASGLNEYAKNYDAIYPIAARCGVFAKTDIQPLINEGANRLVLEENIKPKITVLNKIKEETFLIDIFINAAGVFYGNSLRNINIDEIYKEKPKNIRIARKI